MQSAALLTTDAAINLILDLLLIAFPSKLVAALRIPQAEMAFYPSLLGAVFVGIGVALVIERMKGSSGLGLNGAISINFSAGLVLAIGLLSDSLAIPLRGQILLGLWWQS